MGRSYNRMKSPSISHICERDHAKQSLIQYGYGWQIILNNLTIYQLLSSSLYKKENHSVQNDYDNSTNLPALRYTLNRFRLKDELICAYRVHCNIKTPDRFW